MQINQEPISTDMSCSVIERPPSFLYYLPRAGCPPNPKKHPRTPNTIPQTATLKCLVKWCQYYF